jgi:hypothetical protein
MSLRSANYVNNNTGAHVKEPNKEHDKDHVGETSEDQGMQIPYPEARTARLQGRNSGTMVTLEELVPLSYPQTEAHVQDGTGTTLQQVDTRHQTGPPSRRRKTSSKEQRRSGGW